MLWDNLSTQNCAKIILWSSVNQAPGYSLICLACIKAYKRCINVLLLTSKYRRPETLGPCRPQGCSCHPWSYLDQSRWSLFHRNMIHSPAGYCLYSRHDCHSHSITTTTTATDTTTHDPLTSRMLPIQQTGLSQSQYYYYNYTCTANSTQLQSQYYYNNNGNWYYYTWPTAQ